MHVKPWLEFAWKHQSLNSRIIFNKDRCTLRPPFAVEMAGAAAAAMAAAAAVAAAAAAAAAAGVGFALEALEPLEKGGVQGGD